MSTNTPTTTTATDTATTTGTDAELLGACRSGDSTAAAELFRRYHREALRAAARYAHHDYPASDLVSDAFTGLLRVLARGGGPTDAVLPYLIVSMRNAANGHARRKMHRYAAISASFETLDTIADPGPTVDAALLDDELRRELDLCLTSLAPAWQRMLVLTLVEGLPVGQAAQRMGLSAQAGRALAYRARRGLQAAYVSHKEAQSAGQRAAA